MPFGKELNYTLWNWSRINASAKSIDPCQPAQSAQADMSRNFLLLDNLLQVKAQWIRDSLSSKTKLISGVYDYVMVLLNKVHLENAAIWQSVALHTEYNYCQHQGW